MRLNMQVFMAYPFFQRKRKWVLSLVGGDDMDFVAKLSRKIVQLSVNNQKPTANS